MQSFIKDLQTCIKSTFKTATGNNLASTKLDTFSKSSDSLRQIHLSSGSISSSNNNNSNSNINSSKIKSNVDEKDTHSTFSESLIDFGIRGINMISLNFSEPFARGDQDQHTRNKRKSFNFVSIGAIFGIVMTILNLIWIQRLGAKIETIFVEMGNVHQKVEYRHGKLGPVDQDPITAEEFSEAFNSVLKTQIDEINNHVHALEGIFTASNSQIESIHEDFVKIEETLK